MTAAAYYAFGAVAFIVGFLCGFIFNDTGER